MDIKCTLKGSSKRGEVKNGKEGILERKRMGEFKGKEKKDVWTGVQDKGYAHMKNKEFESQGAVES